MKFKKMFQYFKSLQNLSFFDLAKLSVNLPLYLILSRVTRYCQKRICNYNLLLDLHDKGISKELMLLGIREKEHKLIIEQELQEGMTVLDIGANIGYYSIMMGNIVGERGRIYAVEPAKWNFHMLNLNIRLNNLEDVVETVNVGISNKSGSEKFYESGKSNWHTFYPKVHSLSSTESLINKEPISVPVITIADFMKGRRKIEFIRMDIEGYEVEVLESIVTLLKNKYFSPRILFEVHQPRYHDQMHSMRRCLKDIFDAGYYVKILVSSSYSKRIEKLFTEKGYHPNQVVKTDYLKRGIFYNISDDDAIKLICDDDLVRAVMLQRKMV